MHTYRCKRWHVLHVATERARVQRRAWQGYFTLHFLFAHVDRHGARIYLLLMLDVCWNRLHRLPALATVKDSSSPDDRLGT